MSTSTTDTSQPASPNVDEFADLDENDAVEIRANDLRVGDVFAEYGMDAAKVAARGDHGDTVLITTTDDVETALDGDEAVLVYTRGPKTQPEPTPAESNRIVYVVAVTGGYEDPSFKVTYNLDEAETYYRESVADCIGEPGDRVDLLSFDGTVTTRVEWAMYSDSSDRDENDDVTGLG